MADVFVRRRRVQTRQNYGEIPLSSGEIEYFTRQDEATRRRERLLQTREQEKRVAQMVTQRYRDNLRALQSHKMRVAQREHKLQKDVLLSALHEKYQFSVQGMGTAQRNAREKMMELMELAQIEKHKWAFNRFGEKERFHDAVDAVEEDESQRLARRREIERNLQRLKQMAVKHRGQASSRAKRELELQLQLKQAQEEAQRYRLQHAETEEFSFPRKQPKDVTAYQFTRTHCIAVPGHSKGAATATTANATSKNVQANTSAATRGYREVKVIRHNRVQPNTTSAIDEAEVYRRQMERKKEEEWRMKEQQARAASSRGDNALLTVESIREGQQTLEWLASFDRQERMEMGQMANVNGMHEGEAELDTGSDAFARMFGIEEASGSRELLVGFGDDNAADGPERVAARRVGALDESDESLLFAGEWGSASQGESDFDAPESPVRRPSERAIEHKIETMTDMLKTIASYGDVMGSKNPKNDGQGRSRSSRDGVEERHEESERMRYEEWKKMRGPADLRQRQDEPIEAASDGDSWVETPSSRVKPITSNGSVSSIHSGVHRGDKREGGTTPQKSDVRQLHPDSNDIQGPIHGGSDSLGYQSQNRLDYTNSDRENDDDSLDSEHIRGTNKLQTTQSRQAENETTMSKQQNRIEASSEGSQTEDVQASPTPSLRGDSMHDWDQDARRESLDQLEEQLHEVLDRHRSVRNTQTKETNQTIKADRRVDRIRQSQQNAKPPRVPDRSSVRTNEQARSQPIGRWEPEPGRRATDIVSVSSGAMGGDHGLSEERTTTRRDTMRSEREHRSVFPRQDHHHERQSLDGYSSSASSHDQSEQDGGHESELVSNHNRRRSTQGRSITTTSGFHEMLATQLTVAQSNERGEAGDMVQRAVDRMVMSEEEESGVDDDEGDDEEDEDERGNEMEELSADHVERNRAENSRDSTSSLAQSPRPRASVQWPGPATSSELDHRFDGAINVEMSGSFRNRASRAPSVSAVHQGLRVDQHSDDAGDTVQEISATDHQNDHMGHDDGQYVRSAPADHPMARSPVVELSESLNDSSDFDPSMMLTEAALAAGAGGTSYAIQMQQEGVGMKSSSSSSPLQYSLPLSDSFSSMDDSFIGHEALGGGDALTNQLLPMFLHHRRHSGASTDMESRQPRREITAQGETAILLDGLTPQDEQVGVAPDGQPRVRRPAQPSRDATSQDATTTIGNATTARVKVTENRVLEEEGGIRHRINRAATTSTGTRQHRKTGLQDLSFSSDSSSDMSAYIYLTRMRQMAGTSTENQTGTSRAQPSRQASRRHGNVASSSESLSGLSGMSSVSSRHEEPVQSMEAANINATTRRDSVGSAASSTPSIDARLQYLVNMTAVAGQALPLHLNLPPQDFNSRDMRIPPPNMHQDLHYASDSEASDSVTSQQRAQVNDEDEQPRTPLRHGAAETVPQETTARFPAAPFGGMDRSQPPPPPFARSSSSSVSSHSSHATSNLSLQEKRDSRGLHREQFSLDELKQRLTSLPPQPIGNLDMSQPPAPLAWEDSDMESSVAGSEMVGSQAGDERQDRDEVFLDRRTSLTSRPKGEALFVSLADDQDETREAPGGAAASPDGGASLADAFRMRHPNFHRPRSTSTKSLLDQRREQLQERRSATQVDEADAAARDRSGRPPSTSTLSGRAPPSQMSPSRSRAIATRRVSATPPPPPMSMPKPELLDRLAAGDRAKITAQEMKDRTRRLYNQLPEVTEKKRQEDVLERRRQRLAEMRDREKTRRQQQRQRKDHAEIDNRLKE